jgi:hypothetical protein
VISSQDELWTVGDRETIEHVEARVQSILDDIWYKYPVDTCECERYRLVRGPLICHQSFPLLLIADSSELF